MSNDRVLSVKHKAKELERLVYSVCVVADENPHSWMCSPQYDVLKTHFISAELKNKIGYWMPSFIWTLLAFFNRPKIAFRLFQEHIAVAGKIDYNYNLTKSRSGDPWHNISHELRNSSYFRCLYPDTIPLSLKTPLNHNPKKLKKICQQQLSQACGLYQQPDRIKLGFFNYAICQTDDERRLLPNWRRVAVLLTFIRGNAAHEFRYSILPLISCITRLLV
jgi:hypothetical protein